ncbi:unnamed protein product [Chironomus riparius]|uniref:DUF4806 domain-containing protein n=1 Tax=Chironomus riparius TaxID=315576 RepID=A0A9N9RQR5_9DIPT|nr:unnamed protein product [Chironomus riparius]
MFTVVKNKQNAFYVIRKIWLSEVDEEGKIYAYYPAPAKMNKYLEKGTSVKKNWKHEEIFVQLNDIQDLKEANDFIEKKIQFLNSDVEEKQQNKKIKLNDTESLEEYDFNEGFDEEALDETLLSQVVPNSINQSSIIDNDDVFSETPFRFDSFSPRQVQHTQQGNMVLVSKESLDYLINEIQNIKITQQHQVNLMTNFMEMVRDEFKSLKNDLAAQRNDSLDITYKPPIISTTEELNEMEEKLGLMNESFLNDYKAMFNFYTASVVSPNKNFTVQNGLVHSFLKMYLDINFAKSLIWASVKLTVGFDKYKNHIRFIFLICNKILKNMNEKPFVSTIETESSIQKFFKSIHATPRNKKLNTLDNESQGTQ